MYIKELNLPESETCQNLPVPSKPEPESEPETCDPTSWVGLVGLCGSGGFKILKKPA